MGKISFDKLFVLMQEQHLTSYKIRKDNIIGQGTLQRLRNGESVSTDTIASLCEALKCQPSDIMEYLA